MSLFENPKETKSLLGGEQRVYLFENGYGASVVRHRGSYGGKTGLWELAVLGKDGHLCYDTPITNDVIGYLSETEVEELLYRIQTMTQETIDNHTPDEDRSANFFDAIESLKNML